MEPNTRAPAVAEALREAQRLVTAALGHVQLGLLPDAEAVAVLQGVESLGRVVDGARVSTASQIGKRSATALGHDGLAWRYGCRNAADLITQATRVSSREARRRLELGGMVTDRAGLTGSLPPLFPAVAAALCSGELGVDAAEAIVAVLEPAATRIGPDQLQEAERSLVRSATGAITEENDGLPGAGFAFSADLIRGQATTWLARLDPDGAAPADGSRQAPRSEFGFGSLKNGVYPFRGGATPELKGVIGTVMDAFLSAHAVPTFSPNDEWAAEQQARIDSGEVIPGAETGGVPGDERTAAQKRADILMGVFGAAARDPHSPSMGGAAPTVMVHVDATHLLDGHGVGWIDGVTDPIPMNSVDRLLCAGGYQKIVIGPYGEVLHLGEKERFFTPAQRRAIAARDGGCVIPGCTIPAYWCEVHHVIPWRRSGPTNIDNGVLLCFHHHATIETSGWDIRMVGGVPLVKAPPWLDATGAYRPAPGHRIRHGRRIQRRKRQLN
jgi:hypothetical protein